MRNLILLQKQSTNQRPIEIHEFKLRYFVLNWNTQQFHAGLFVKLVSSIHCDDNNESH